MNLNRSYKIVLAALFAAQGFLAVAQTNDIAAPPDYSTFTKFIAQRNIFDPNRLPMIGSVAPRPIVRFQGPQTASFSLVGVIGYGDGKLAGVYAFFDGTSLQYQKPAQVNDSIAIFKVTAITADSVTLLSGTNTIVLGIGEQLHDAGGGKWVFANGTTLSYNNFSGFGTSRNRNGNGNGGGRLRRNNIFGGGNGGNNGNFNRNRNDLGASAQSFDNSQAQDPNAAAQNDNAAQDNGLQDAGAQDNTAVPQAGQPAAPSGDLGDPIAKLKAARAAELQQIGH